MPETPFVQLRKAVAVTLAGNAAVAFAVVSWATPSPSMAAAACGAVAVVGLVGGLWAWRSLRAEERRRTELLEANARLTLLSTTDGLLGIANRRHFEMVFEAEWARCARAQRPLALLLVDVDHFKSFNDWYGHPAGDDCLRRCASGMEDALRRPADLLGRYGGEEFVMLLPETNLVGAHHVAAQLHRAVGDAAIAHKPSPWGRVTISIGIAAVVPTPGAPRRLLLESADAALYRAKAGGRNRTVAESMHPADIVPLAPRRLAGLG